MFCLLGSSVASYYGLASIKVHRTPFRRAGLANARCVLHRHTIVYALLNEFDGSLLIRGQRPFAARRVHQPLSASAQWKETKNPWGWVKQTGHFSKFSFWETSSELSRRKPILCLQRARRTKDKGSLSITQCCEIKPSFSAAFEITRIYQAGFTRKNTRCQISRHVYLRIIQGKGNVCDE